jgi:hypothetical protein
MALAEHEIAERDRRRIERHLGEAKLLPGKTLDNFDFDSVPMVSRAQVAALCAGDGWLRNGATANLILMGPPGGGKSHLSSASASSHPNVPCLTSLTWRWSATLARHRTLMPTVNGLAIGLTRTRSSATF